MKHITIATKNKGKAIEFKAFFKPFQVEAHSLLELAQIPEDIEEIGTTFEENAELKAKGIAEQIAGPVLADDSGLVIDGLDGRPGVYSARFAGERATDEENIQKVLQEMNEIKEDERTARFVSVLALYIPGKGTFFSKGYCEGKISFQKRGINGFGYDPIFVPNGYTETLAELSATEKNRISHRSKAMKEMESILQELF